MSIARNKINWRLLTVTVLLLSGKALTQPYLFYMNGGSGNASDIYRLDLSTGQSQFFVGGIPNCQGVIADPTDQWVYIPFGQGGAYLFIVNATDTSKMFEPLMNESAAGEVGGFIGVVYVPQANKFYVTWLKNDTSRTTIYDATTFKKLGNINFGFTFGATVSPDGQYIYQYGLDSLRNGSLTKFSTATNSVVSTIPMLNVGPATPDKAIESESSDRLLLGWMHPGDNPEFSGYYSVYNVSSGMNLPAISYPFICDAYLSGDGNYVIFNRWNPIITDSTNNTGYAIYPGTVYVFNSNTGQLTQRLSLPPNGKILVIDGYPQMFYYYNDSTNQAVAISDTAVTPTNALIDTLISLKHQAVAKGWLRDDRDRGDDIDEMMRGNDWYNEGEFKKFRSWEVGKDWKFDRDWNNGIVGVLDKRLDMAKRALSRGDSVMARRDLEIFVMEVELLNNLSAKLVKRGEGPILTSEGYLSMRFNAEYLIDRLPEERGRGDEGEGRGKK